MLFTEKCSSKAGGAASDTQTLGEQIPLYPTAIFDLNTDLTGSMKQAWKQGIYFPCINFQVVIREGKYGFQASEAL